MKKLLIPVLLFFVATSAFGVPFNPDVLRINAAQNINYNFDGSTLSIPITISGTSANLFFFVYTKDMASKMAPTKNGFLGWHYVNKIDTCITWIGPFAMEKGSNTVLWDGKDKDHAMVPAGDYTYYMYAYDGKSMKKLATSFMSLGFGANATFTTGTVVTDDSKGNPLAQPAIYGYGKSKWTIGGDPFDPAYLETCALGGVQIEFVPGDHKYFFCHIPAKDTPRIGKYEWVPNGAAILQTAWGDNGYVQWNKPSVDYWDIALSGDMIAYGFYEAYTHNAHSELALVDQSDGSVMKMIDLSDRWSSIDDDKKGAQMNGGPGQLVGRNNMVIMSSFCDCYREMVNPAAEDEADLVLWGNGNGDYVGDHNFEVGSQFAWVCMDFMPAPYTYNTDADANMFSTCGAYDLGALSFIMFGPDGTGIGNFAFAGETAGVKYGMSYVDYGSSYDGMYCDNYSTAGSDVDKTGIWFIGHDSIKGLLSNKVAVADAAPAAFSVAQNTPNPFNPSTTITFNLAKAGKVTVDVYNVAGQKVSTLVNGSMNAGSHSVVWNAADHSAGLYFCTVKSGSFSKTVKMTLLK